MRVFLQRFSLVAAVFVLFFSPFYSRAQRIAATDTMGVKEVLLMPKVDAHAHVMALNEAGEKLLLAFLEKNNFHWLDICTGGLRWGLLQRKMAIAQHLHRTHPERFDWAVSFNLTNWGSPGWQKEAISTVDWGFSQGALAVKVWKEIGMELQDPDHRYVMIDDPRFGPVLDEVQRRGRTLVAHLGEPRNCWLPLDKMTTASDRRYFTENPQYHAFLHPEIPDYWKQIAARDRVLEQRPGLRMVGCHLGSLEFDVDELAKRLDKYPNFAVDLAARLVHLQIQPRDKVRNFLLKYQDRVLYGTDLTFGSESGELPGNARQVLSRFEETYRLDATWLATDQMVDVPRASASYKSRGVALPASVLRKIYYENSRRWYGVGTDTAK